MLLHTAGIDGTGFSLERMEYFAASRIAAFTFGMIKRTGSALSAAAGEPQYLPLLLFGEAVKYETV